MKYLLILAAVVVAVSSHATMMDPVNRDSAWKKGFPTPINYNDDDDECGWAPYHSLQIPATCTPCGPARFPKEGPIVKTYKAGQKIDIQIAMKADHSGYYTFRLCPNPNAATEECFEQHRLPVFNSPLPQTKENFDRYEWYFRNQELNGQTQHVQSQLPATLRREHCILQWTWHCNNMYAENPAQVWRQCADIKIE